tara:strand:+ start:238 stop:468 length:231 start_codon:yes stop_codon:yes gene_type:complete
MNNVVHVLGISQTILFEEATQVTQLVLQNGGTGQQIGVPISDDVAMDVLNFVNGEASDEETFGASVQDEVEACSQL